MAGGQFALANHLKVADSINNSLGRRGVVLTSFMAGTFARGVAIDLGFLLLGALLAAVAIGLPAEEEQPPVAAADDVPRRSSVRGAVYGPVALAVVLGGGSVLSLGRSEPGTGSVLIWLGALAAALCATWAFDRVRCTCLGNPFAQRGERMLLFVVMAADLLLVGHDLAHYRWAGTPDESFFFMTARDIALGRLQRFPLSENGVFGYHPLLSSYYQAAFMKVFGINVFGWRLSSAAALAMSLPFLYLFTREIWNRRAGWIAVVLFGSAQVAVGFSHLGYNNVQVYPAILGALGVLAWCIPRRSLAGHYLAGSIAGLAVYTFYPARLTPLLVIMLVWSWGRLSLKRAGAELLALGLGILLAVLPVLAHPGEIVTNMLRQTAFGERRLALTNWGASVREWASNPALLKKIGSDWLVSIFYAPWTKCGWNFDWNPAVDPATAALAMLGLWLGVLALARRSRARFIVPAYVLSAFVVGAITQHDCPPLTRLLTLAPFTALLAAIALDRLMSWASQSVRYRSLVRVGGAGLVTGAVVWNVAALHESIYHLHRGYGSGTSSELIRITKDLPKDCSIVYIQNDDNDMYSADYILHEYGLGERSTHIRPFGPRALGTLASVPAPFVVVYDLRHAAEIRAVEGAVELRFPQARWRDSAPGQRWNLRYCSVPDGLVPP